MKKSKHKPPSRIRYEKNNPVVSFRIKKVWYDEFKAFLINQGLSIGDFFRIAFEKQKDSYERFKEKWYAEGYNKAVSDWQIWFFCKICGKRIDIEPNSDPHKDLIEYMKNKGWAHTECLGKKDSYTY
jgi:hypothetical protein